MYKHAITVLGLAICLIISAVACKKDDGDDNSVANPIVNLAPASQKANAGQTVFINLTASDFNKLSRMQATEQFRSYPERSLLDSTFNPAKSAIDYNFTYKTPDSAKVGETITLKFTVTDADNNQKVKNATVEIE